MVVANPIFLRCLASAANENRSSTSPMFSSGPMCTASAQASIRTSRQACLRCLRLYLLPHDQPFGDVATDFTRQFFRDQLLTAIVEGKDRYGRHLAWIKVGDKDLSEELLRAGLAWHYKEYSDDAELAALEDAARAGGVGLWADEDAVAPREWRNQARETE